MMPVPGKNKTIDFPQRLFVFGGAYGNLHATRAVFEKAEMLGFSDDEIIFTGDMVAYCANPQETVDLIRSRNISVIKGNCEESLGMDAEDCGCGFEEGSTCSLLSDQWYRFCQSNLDQETRQWMAGLPANLDITVGGFRLLCTHGTPETINRFVFPSDISMNRYTPSSAEEFDGYIVGHSGLPFASKINDRLWFNSGASGMPANDGTARVWCGVMEVIERKLRVQTIAVDYDHTGAAQQMSKRGLENGYQACLSTGIWPSHDVMPDEEKALTGVAITPSIFNYHRNRVPAAAA